MPKALAVAPEKELGRGRRKGFSPPRHPLCWISLFHFSLNPSATHFYRIIRAGSVASVLNAHMT